MKQILATAALGLLVVPAGGALAVVASSEEPTGVWKVTVASEKSALGTNSVPKSGTMATLMMNTPKADSTVARLWRKAQRKMA